MLGAILLAALTATPSPSASPTPAPSPLREIGRTTTATHLENLVGKAASASTGRIDASQIETRPALRPGEVLEAIPGLVTSQHSGEGKANQYYLRGFQLDHGTDLAATIVGEPINLPTHAHGQGYSDVNWLIPELISYIRYRKGPYAADAGDFSTAGAYELFYRDTMPFTFEAGTGGFGYGRVLIAGSPAAGKGNLLYAFEAFHDDGSFDRPDNYRRLNGVLRYSRSTTSSTFNLTALGYQGRFDSSDQIPQRLVDAGIIDRNGLIDPTDGGITHRYALSTQYEKHDAGGVTRLAAYGIDSYLDLFSNFTYYAEDATDYYNVTQNPLTCYARYSTCAPGHQHAGGYVSYCPANTAAPGPGGAPAPFSFSCGDQREQQDQRVVMGFDLSRSWTSRTATTTLGVGFRDDNISTLGLFLTHARARYPDGTLTDDHVVERDGSAYAESQISIGSKLRLIGGLRSDLYAFKVLASNFADSGNAAAGLILPKLSAAYALSRSQELYVNAGESFHSNDARVITGSPVQDVSPLVRASGYEAGSRFASRRLNVTLAAWRLFSSSELVFNGDNGTTSTGRPTVRQGIELSSTYAVSQTLRLDTDLATSTARFTSDPNNVGTGVPESLGAVASLGATYDRSSSSLSLRVRYFGPRTLVEDGSATSSPSTLLNAKYTAKVARGWRASLEVLNLLGARVDDIEYFYASWLPQDATNAALRTNVAINPALGGTGVNDVHFHPSQARTLRLALRKTL